MKRLSAILSLILTTYATMFMYAQYSLHDFKGDVKVIQKNVKVPATKGMSLKAPDYIVIPQGAWVQIFTTMGSKIYKSTEHGTFKVTDIIFNAGRDAKDHGRNINRGMALGGKRKKDNPIYVDKGIVMRSLAVFDPDAQNLTVDPEIMAQVVINTMVNNTRDELPMPIITEINDTTLSFNVANSLNFHIYFNILKIDESERVASVSRLGLPIGTYVLPPNNTMTRTCIPDKTNGVHNIIVMTFFPYNTNDLIENLNRLLRTGGGFKNLPEDTPVFTELF